MSAPAFARHGWRRAGPGRIACPNCDERVSSNALARAAHRCGFVIFDRILARSMFWDDKRQAFNMSARAATIYGTRQEANARRVELVALGHANARIDNKGALK